MANLLRAFFPSLSSERERSKRGLVEIQHSLEEEKGAKNCKTMHYNWIFREILFRKVLSDEKRDFIA
jgi:hypothetical protein